MRNRVTVALLLMMLASLVEIPLTYAQDAAPADDDEMIQLTFPPSLEVRVLVEYVSKSMGINILYDDAVSKKRVTILSPAKIPRSSLPGLLQSMLRMAGLTMVDADQPGWKQIVPNKDLFAVTGAFERDPSVLAAAGTAEAITQVFTIKHSTVAAVGKMLKPFLSTPGGNMFSIPDQRLLIVSDYAGQLRRIVDVIAMLDVPRREATMRFVPVTHLDAKQLATQVMELLKQKDSVAAGTDKARARKLTLTTEPRSNQIVVISTDGSDAEAIELIEKLDVASGAETRTYRFKHIAPKRVDNLMKGSAGTGGFGSLYTSTIDAEAGLLVVSALPNMHERVESLRRDLDVAQVQAAASPMKFYRLMNTTAAEVLSTIRSLETGEFDLATIAARTGEGADAVDSSTHGPSAPPPPKGEELPKLPDYKAKDTPESSTVERDTESPGSKITAGGEAIVTGDLDMTPGTGFNGALLNPHTVNAVIKALASSGRATVMSAPKVLVSDNSSATLSSVSEAPFTSINSSETVSTTSFGGYQSAGTTITVTPHVSEGDHLQLEYSITLNSFTGDGGGGIPPPRQTNTINSQVVVPDGHAVLVGGLVRKDDSETVTKIPILGDIPLLKYLFSLRTKTASENTLFVFIRPVILRDDKFEDLKYLSDRDRESAELLGEYPVGEPMLMR